MYFNQATASPEVYGNINLTYSCISTSLSGTGNITSDPQFVDTLNSDFHLQSGSPCIDSGNPTSPLDPDGTVADMGALYHSQLPSLSVSPSNLFFYGIAGTGNPADQTFQISNSGNGTFNYTLSESISWLTISPAFGGPVPPTATETVSVDISGLSVGTYQGDIIVTANGAQGSPDTVSISLIVTQDPILSVSPKSLTFSAEVGGSNPTNQTFQVSNLGSSTFNYTISESISWLNVTPTSGGPVPPTATGTVSVDISGLSAGTYQGDIIVTANGVQGSPDTVSVTLNIIQNPILSVSPESLTFYAEAGGNNPANQTFQINNAGSGTFNYIISESVSWLDVTPTSGGPVPPTATETVSVDISGLSAGAYQCYFIVVANGVQGSPDTVSVTLFITQNPILAILPDNIQSYAEVGGNNPGDAYFYVDNIGSGSFNYTITENVSWLSVSTTNGGPVPPMDNIVITFDITGLQVGDYQGDVIVHAPGALNNPDTVIVSLEITQSPILSVTPDTLIFITQIAGDIPDDQIIQITNIGTGTFDYTITENISWLSVSNMSGGPVPPSAADTVSVDTTGLIAGTYEGDIVITASGAQGSPDTVHVIFNIESQSVLLLEREEIIFHVTQGGEIPSPETFTIANAGGGSFYFEAIESASWLELSDTSGGPVPPTFEDTVFVVNISGLSPGIYEHDIVIHAEGALQSPDSIHVILDITTNGLLWLENTEIPTEYALQPPYPNPFNPVTNLAFALPQPGNIRIAIFDIHGRIVANLMDNWCGVGVYQVTFDASKLSSGTYFCQMAANNFMAVKKLILIK